MGATLQLDGVTVQYFAIQISAYDEQVLKQNEAPTKVNKLGKPLQIRSDNVGAPTMLTRLRGGSRQLTLIACEYALDLGQAQWKPDIVTHTFQGFQTLFAMCRVESGTLPNGFNFQTACQEPQR